MVPPGLASRRHRSNEGIALSDSVRRHRHPADVLKDRSIARTDNRGVKFVKSVPEDVESSQQTSDLDLRFVRGRFRVSNDGWPGGQHQCYASRVVSSLRTLGPPYLSLHPFSARGPDHQYHPTFEQRLVDDVGLSSVNRGSGANRATSKALPAALRQSSSGSSSRDAELMQ